VAHSCQAKDDQNDASKKKQEADNPSYNRQLTDSAETTNDPSYQTYKKENEEPCEHVAS
jgi:hypothetical protein